VRRAAIIPHSMLRLLYVVNGEDRATPLTGGRVRLGRGSDNDVVLYDVSVSRYHAEILREPDGWSVHDLKSTNGVEVNGVPVEKAPLRPGDRMAVGAFEIRVEAVEGILTVQVSDDGVGGADPGRGTGLRGLGQRIRSVDGSMNIDSPPGGPTVLVVELPCAS